MRKMLPSYNDDLISILSAYNAKEVLYEIIRLEGMSVVTRAFQELKEEETEAGME